eukprot:scaffold54221_cov55-Phaeocystis_antarctica.AAC.7
MPACAMPACAMPACAMPATPPREGHDCHVKRAGPVSASPPPHSLLRDVLRRRDPARLLGPAMPPYATL